VIRIVDIPDPTITPVDTLCEFGPDITLSAATPGGTWSGPGIIQPSAGTFSPPAAGPGTHEIIYSVTDGNDCSASDTIEIVVQDSPDGFITPIDPVCFNGQPVDLEASTPLGTWTGNGITNASTGTFDPILSGIGSHTVTFKTLVDPTGCFGTDTTTIHVVPPPFAAFLTPDSSWCQQAANPSLATIMISGLDTTLFDLVYEMGSVTDTLFSLSAGPFDLFLDNLPGMNRNVLKEVIEHHGGNSCSTPLADTLVMNVNPLPIMNLRVIYQSDCSPVLASFVAEEGYSSYFWNFGDGQVTETTNNETSHTYTFSYADNYIIIGEDIIYDLTRHDTVYTMTMAAETIEGCSDTTEFSIKVYPTPEADFFVTPDLLYYPDSLISIINLSSVGVWDYLWDFGDGTQDTVKEPYSHIYDLWGFVDIGLKTFSPHCRDSIVKRIQILPPPPVAGFEPDTIGCPPLNITFTNNSEFADTYIWDFDDGKFSTEENPTHIFYQSKEHRVKLIAFGLSGSDTTEQIVFLHERPQSIFDAYPRTSKNLKQVFKFINNSINWSYNLWDFGDGTTSAEQNPFHIYEDSGTYTITLYVWSENDCVDTLIQPAFIQLEAGEGSIKFPNVFKWNGSGPSGGHWEEGVINNEVFHPVVINATSLKLIIYTRWGEKVFESNDLYVGWDGYLGSGQLATEGVYVWKAWVTYVDGREEVLAGDITFLH
jgi:PKD repeat protein